jgi:hypothetical protein
MREMMRPHSILAGKIYQTAQGELRRVISVIGDVVVYKSILAPPGVIRLHDEMKTSLREFAQQAEGEHRSLERTGTALQEGGMPLAFPP